MAGSHFIGVRPCILPSILPSGCVPGGDLSFSTVFSDQAVLQMEPARAAVYGFVGTNASKGGYGSAKVTVAVAGGGGARAYSVDATVDPASGAWKAFLNPAAAGGPVPQWAQHLAGELRQRRCLAPTDALQVT
eukprot:gene8196-667_t